MPKRNWLSIEHKIFEMDNGKIYARPSIPGEGRKEFPLGDKSKFKSLKQMIAAKDRKVAEILRRDEPKPKSLVRFEELAEEILKLKSGRAEATRVSANLHIKKHLLPWFNEHYPFADQVNEATWEEYILAQRFKNPTRKLFNDRKHISMIMRHAFRKGVISRPMSFRNPDPERKAGKRLSDQEVGKLLGASKHSIRLQILMGVTMGMRKSEILQLAWERVDLSEQTIHLRAQDTKIRRARTMGMSAQVYQTLSAREQISPFVFPSREDHSRPSRSNRTAWSATKRRANVSCRFHDLRHTFLSVALLERKLNPLHVAVYAGVSLSEIQKTYLHPTVEDTRSVAYDFGGKWGNAK